MASGRKIKPVGSDICHGGRFRWRCGPHSNQRVRLHGSYVEFRSLPARMKMRRFTHRTSGFGRKAEKPHSHAGPVSGTLVPAAQPDGAPPSEGGDRRFKSSRVRRHCRHYSPVIPAYGESNVRTVWFWQLKKSLTLTLSKCYGASGRMLQHEYPNTHLCGT